MLYRNPGTRPQYEHHDVHTLARDILLASLKGSSSFCEQHRFDLDMQGTWGIAEAFISQGVQRGHIVSPT